MTAPAGRSAIVSGMASILAHLTVGNDAERLGRHEPATNSIIVA